MKSQFYFGVLHRMDLFVFVPFSLSMMDQLGYMLSNDCSSHGTLSLSALPTS